MMNVATLEHAEQPPQQSEGSLAAIYPCPFAPPQVTESAIRQFKEHYPPPQAEVLQTTDPELHVIHNTKSKSSFLRARADRIYDISEKFSYLTVLGAVYSVFNSNLDLKSLPDRAVAVAAAYGAFILPRHIVGTISEKMYKKAFALDKVRDDSTIKNTNSPFPPPQLRVVSNLPAPQLPPANAWPAPSKEYMQQEKTTEQIVINDSNQVAQRNPRKELEAAIDGVVDHGQDQIFDTMVGLLRRIIIRDSIANGDDVEEILVKFDADMLAKKHLLQENADPSGPIASFNEREFELRPLLPPKPEKLTDDELTEFLRVNNTTSKQATAA